MPRKIVVVFLAALAGCGTQSPPAPESGQPVTASPGTAASTVQSTDELDGRWQVVSLLKDGQEASDPNGAPLVIEFHDGNQTMTQGGAFLDESQYSIDSTTTPRSIDTIHKAGGGASAVTPGIYEVNGDDLRLCMGSQKPRPNEFSSTPQSGYNLIVLKRIKAK